MDRAKILATFQTLRAEGRQGFTVDADGNEYGASRGGYAVGFRRYDDVEEAVLAMEPGLLLGYWVSESPDGDTYIDLVQVFSTKAMAMIAACVRGEIAVYGFVEDELIYIGPMSDQPTNKESNYYEKSTSFEESAKP